jgi:hypothetical protein
MPSASGAKWAWPTSRPRLQHHPDRRPPELQQPIVDVIGNRALPSSFEGVIHSEEFNNLSFLAAPSTASRHVPKECEIPQRIRQWRGNRPRQHPGINYQPLKSLTTSLYAAKVEDFWNQYYFGATHVLGDSQC